MDAKTKKRDPREVPTAWFAVLEDARRKGDPDREREAIRNLERLGVRVAFCDPAEVPAMPETRPPEILPAGAVVTSREFKSRFRIGEAGWRQLKRDGLRVHRIGKMALVTTSDFLAFLEQQEADHDQ